ncbi:MAG: hypothetical protein SFZ23_05540 [Planctomycetota bacterium]|nr:hypothetical protein [Planctomycetota bacterium]
MTARVCYVRQGERGALLRELRFVVARAEGTRDETWTPAETLAADGVSPLAQVESAAHWITERLGPQRKAGLDVLCLDPEGAVCTWMSTPSTEGSVVALLARQAGAEGEGGGAGSMGLGSSGSGMQGASGGSGEATHPLAFYAGTASQASVQVLSPDDGREADPERPGLGGGLGGGPTGRNGRAASGSAGRLAGLLAGGLAGGSQRQARQADTRPRKRAVVAYADATARALHDALDRRGIGAGRVLSLWHGMALAWDRASSSSRNVAADSPRALATVLVLSREGDAWARLVWTWSIDGTLLAAGSMRLSRTAQTSARSGPVPVVDHKVGARLASEWLSWSAQNGCAPARVACIVPAEAEPGAVVASPMVEGLDRFGAALTAGWPGATVDVIAHADPLLATLERLAGTLERLDEEDPTSRDVDARTGGGLAALSERPTRSTRATYVWVSLALLAMAGLLGWMALRMRSQAAQASLAARETRGAWEDLVSQRLPAALDSIDGPIAALEGEVVKGEKLFKPPEGAQPAPPVLEELDTLSMVFGQSGVELVQVDVNPNAVVVQVRVADVEEFETLTDALTRISGSWVSGWVTRDVKPVGGTDQKKLTATFVGSWSREATAFDRAAARAGLRPAPAPEAQAPEAPAPESVPETAPAREPQTPPTSSPAGSSSPPASSGSEADGAEGASQDRPSEGSTP